VLLAEVHTHRMSEPPSAGKKRIYAWDGGKDVQEAAREIQKFEGEGSDDDETDVQVRFDPRAVTRFQCVGRLRGEHMAGISSVAVSDDGTVATSSLDGTARMWGINPPGHIRLCRMGKTNEKSHEGWVLHCAFSPDGKYLATTGADKLAKLWRVADAELIFTFAVHADMVMGCAWSKDGERIATCSKDRTIALWSLEKALILHKRAGACNAGAPLKARIQEAGKQNGGHTDIVQRVAWSPKKRHFLLSCSHDKTVKLWDMSAGNSGRLVQTLAGHTDHVLGLEYSHNGEWAVSCSHDATVRVWNMTSFQCRHVLRGHRDIVYHACFSPDATCDRIMSTSHNGTVIIWDTHTGEKLSKVRTGHTSWVLGCAFMPNGVQAITCSGDQSCRIWNAERPKEGFFGSSIGRQVFYCLEACLSGGTWLR